MFDFSIAGMMPKIDGITVKRWTPTSNVSLACMASPLEVLTPVGIAIGTGLAVLAPFVDPTIKANITDPILNGFGEALGNITSGGKK